MENIFFLENYIRMKFQMLKLLIVRRQPAAWGKFLLKNDDAASSNASAYNYSIISSNYNYENEAKFTISDAGNMFS